MLSFVSNCDVTQAVIYFLPTDDILTLRESTSHQGNKEGTTFCLRTRLVRISAASPIGNSIYNSAMSRSRGLEQAGGTTTKSVAPRLVMFEAWAFLLPAS